MYACLPKTQVSAWESSSSVVSKPWSRLDFILLTERHADEGKQIVLTVLMRLVGGLKSVSVSGSKSGSRYVTVCQLR